MQEARRHGAFVGVHQTNTTVRVFAVRYNSCEDHPTCKKVRDCERGMRPNAEASARRGRAVKVLITTKDGNPLGWLALGRSARGRGFGGQATFIFLVKEMFIFGQQTNHYSIP
jgi:hypothetical protein